MTFKRFPWKHYAEVLATAAVKANSMVAQRLFNKATRGDGAASITAGIFWIRTRGRWREHNVHEVTGPNGGPIQMVDVSVLSDAEISALQPVLAVFDAHDRILMMSTSEEKAWPADRVEARATSCLVPYARNSRTH